MSRRFAAPAGRLHPAVCPMLCALCVIALPAALLAQTPQQQMPRESAAVPVVDVELGPQGQWSAVVIDAEGMAVGNLPARLSNGHGLSALVMTDREGRFALSGLPTGVHQLDCGGSWHLYRFWKNGTAPPRAVQHTLVIADRNVVRGVQGSRIYDWMADHPVLTYTSIAAVIAVPVAVIGVNQSSQPASP